MAFVRARDLIVHHELRGPRHAPVLAFTNSLGTSLAMWDAQAAAFAETHRVLRYDLRGHGLTNLGESDGTVRQLADDLLALLDAVDVRRAHVVGISLGGMVAQRVAAAAPERVEKLVLCATGSRIGVRAAWDARIATIEREGMSAIREGGLERWFCARTRETQWDLVRGYGRMMERTPPDGYIAGCRAVRDADLRADDAAIVAPALILAGREDSVTTPQMAAELQAAIGRSRVRVFDDAAHLFPAEQPAAVTAAIAAFLEEPS